MKITIRHTNILRRTLGHQEIFHATDQIKPRECHVKMWRWPLSHYMTERRSEAGTKALHLYVCTYSYATLGQVAPLACKLICGARTIQKPKKEEEEFGWNEKLKKESEAKEAESLRSWGSGVCHLTTSHNYTTKMNNIKRNYTPGRRTEGQPWVSEGEGQDKALRRHKTKGPLAQRQKTEDRRHQLPLNPTARFVYHFSWRAARLYKHTHRETFILDVSCRLTVALFSATWKCNCSRLITSQLIYSLPHSKLSRKDVW